MCGIAGFLVQNGYLPGPWEEILISMVNEIAHRGPDNNGVWVDQEAGVGLAHRRLSIVDLSMDGCQPMHSSSGRFTIVFNGEIYNYRQIRKKLVGYEYIFKGHSDTEVMLAAIEEWGIKKAVKQFIGMFAFVLWDSCSEKMYLVRDRLGEKPLYYGNIGSAFIFGSELKALKAYPQWKADIDVHALGMYLRHGYISAPHSIYKNIQKLIPGTILTVDKSKDGFEYKTEKYWSMNDVIKNGREYPVVGPEEEMVAGLEQLILDSVKQQMVADVPLGAFLSGGVDSTTVVALMQSLSTHPVETFTVGFNYDGFDEANYARKIAKYLGTKHTELYLGSEQVLSVIPELANIYDEPLADSSQIPTYLVSQLARRHVTVCLSGDGGDELFCGYSRYILVKQLWMKIAWMPISIRKKLANYLLNMPTEQLNYWLDWLAPLFNKYGHESSAGDKIKKAALLLNAENNAEFYNSLTMNWADAQKIMQISFEENKLKHPIYEKNKYLDKEFISKMMYSDILNYLPDDILVKVDRAAMANSLESRIPFLDHRIVEYAWRLPLSVKYKNKQTKWIIRQVLQKYVPKDLFERPKMGFTVPMIAWLRGPLREWAEELLDENRLRSEGYLNPYVIREKWTEHLQGKRNWQSQLWSVLIFQSWYQNH